MPSKEVFEKVELLIKNLEKVIRGKRDVLKLAVAALLSKGHLLIEDVPGVGKTTLAHSIARSIDATFKRIQFTSDLLPSDIIGVSIYNESNGSFEFRHGPIFANVVLADEINRATPKTQSALLEAMNEATVSVDNITYQLPKPFMLIATENPMEYAGTFPLPESQLDRFILSLKIGYPEEEVEKEIIKSSPESLMPEGLSPVITSGDVIAMQEETREVKVDESLTDYMLKIVKATRGHKEVKLGVSPRGTMALYRVSQAMALVNGRQYSTPDDIKNIAEAVLSHRIVLIRGRGEMEESPRIIEEILDTITVPL